MRLGSLQIVGTIVCEYLQDFDRFALATVLRLESVQAAILPDLSSFNMFAAIRRSDMELLEFLRQHGQFRFRQTAAKDKATDEDEPEGSSSGGEGGQHRQSSLDEMSEAVAAVSREGSVRMLQWLKDNTPRHPLVRKVSVSLSEYGPVAVPKRWKKTRASAGASAVERGGARQRPERNGRITLTHTAGAVDGASVCGRLDVLQWWKDSGLQLYYTNEAIDSTGRTGRVSVLQWWKNSGLPLVYSDKAMCDASECGHIEVLEWWKASGLKLKYSADALAKAGCKGHVPVLQWWIDSKLYIDYDTVAVDEASLNGRTDVLQWWKDVGPKMLYTSKAMDEVGVTGHTESLQWWKDSGLELRYTEESVNLASEYGQIAVLQWWKDSGLQMRYTDRALHSADENQHLHVLEWWKDSGMDLARYFTREKKACESS